MKAKQKYEQTKKNINKKKKKKKCIRWPGNKGKKQGIIQIHFKCFYRLYHPALFSWSHTKNLRPFQ